MLFMDNAGCHPPQLLQEKYSNIKITFLPANTTSKLQPLDSGIIKNFKVYYRKLLLRYIVAKIDQHSLASDVATNINVLQAIRWMAEAWKQVSCETIKKCFKNAGILTDQQQCHQLMIHSQTVTVRHSSVQLWIQIVNWLALYHNSRLMTLAQQKS